MKREGRLHSADGAGWSEKLDEKIYSSVIAKRFRRFINWLYSLLINGFFGKIFTAYSAEEELFMNSRFVHAFGRGNRARRIASKVKVRIAKLFEGSRILAALGDLVASLIHRRLKTYGAFLLSLGAYGAVTYLIREYVLVREGGDASDLVVCGVFLLLSFPLMMTRETFATAVLKSRFMCTFLFDGLGIPRDSFSKTAVFPKRYSTVTAIGMILGALTYFVSPIYYVMGVVLLLLVALVFSYPELGVLAMIALVPLSALFAHPSLVLLAVIVVTMISYFVKLIRGKRVFKLRLIDFAILVFAVLVLAGGIISAGGEVSLASALLYVALMAGYFLTVNLIRTRVWVRRCVIAFLIFGGLSAVIGIAQIFTGSLELSWLDTELFSGIDVRITSTFENPNVYASYLLLLTPFAMAFLVRKGSVRPKVALALGLILFAICLVETWSRGAWIGILVALLLFFLVYTRRSVPYLLLAGAAVPFAGLVLPENMISRFLSIGNLADSSTTYRISAWRGVARMLQEHWIGGIGVGEAAFSAVYPAFSYAGIQGIRHTHNLYLQIVTETGIMGLLVFSIVMLLFIQNCFCYIYRMRNEEETSLVTAGLVAIIAMLIMGMTDYVWYSYRVFLMFWLVIAIVNAYIRIGEDEFDRFTANETNSDYSVNFDLNVDNL